MKPATIALPSIARGVSWTALMQISSTLLVFATAVLAARILGVDGYSTLQLAIGWINISTVVCGLGLATVVLRSSGEASTLDEWRTLKGLIRCALSASGVAVFAIGVLSAIAFFYFNRSDQFALLLIGLVVIVAQQQRAIFQALLNGQALFAQSGLGEFTTNLLMALVLAGLFILQSHALNSAENILTLRLMATISGVTVLVLLWRKHVRNNLPTFTTASASYQPQKWICSGLPIMLIAGASIINANADILMIDTLHDRAAVGPYHAATRGAGLVLFSLSILIVPLSPIISKLYTSDVRQMFAIVFKWTALAFATSLVVAGILLIYANNFLSLFGDGFLLARLPMTILILAQLVNVLVGPMQYILVMASHERIAAACMIAGTATNIIANAILIPKYGLLGAAIGTALSILVWNALSVICVYLTVWKNTPAQMTSAQNE